MFFSPWRSAALQLSVAGTQRAKFGLAESRAAAGDRPWPAVKEC